MKINLGINDLYASHEDLIRLGAPGEILEELVSCEGRATWIPTFVNWLFEKFEVERKEAV